MENRYNSASVSFLATTGKIFKGHLEFSLVIRTMNNNELFTVKYDSEIISLIKKSNDLGLSFKIDLPIYLKTFEFPLVIQPTDISLGSNSDHFHFLPRTITTQ